MPLIRCSECGREISDKASACPGCGAPASVAPSMSEAKRHEMMATTKPPVIPSRPPVPPSPPTIIYQQLPPKKKKGMGLFSGCVVLPFALIALLFGGYKVFDYWEEVSYARADPATKAAKDAAKAAQAAAGQEEVLAIELISRSQEAVTKRLKAPRTAKFPSTLLLLGRHEYKIYKMPGGSYRVFSWVDSQNGFGAMIRSQWMVELKGSGDQWEVVTVTVE